MLKNLRKITKYLLPQSLTKPILGLNANVYHETTGTFPYFSYENSENLRQYTNIKLIHPKDIETFLNGIDTFIYDCDGVIVNNKFLLFLIKNDEF